MPQETHRRLRILIIAEEANPEWTSVPLIGWFLSEALAKVADVHIVTQVRNKAAFERAGLREGHEFSAIDTEWISAPADKLANLLTFGAGKGWTTLQAFHSLTYPNFERQVWKRFGAAIRNHDFDLVHRITPMSPTIASPIAPKCKAAGVPFIVGPLNGGLPWPRAYMRERMREHEWLSFIRNAYKVLPYQKKMLSCAAAILVGSRYTETEIPTRYHPKTIYVSESAVNRARFTLAPKTTLSDPLQACFIGRMVPYKGPDRVLEAALPYLQNGSLKLDMIGEGPLLGKLKAFVETHRLGDAVTFIGQVPHHELQKVAHRSDIFLFPSIREFGGTAILETMSIGLVPVIVDYGGPGDNVTSNEGIKIPLLPPRDLIMELRRTLGEITAEPKRLLEMRQSGQERIETYFTWEKRAGQILEIYDWVLHNDGPKPTPFS